MGMIKNGDGVTINEVTVSHRAMSNSPHDAVTFDPGKGIRGVNIGGQVWHASEDTVIRSVNVSFDGVSVDCNTEFLQMLSDKEFRAALVARTKAAHEEQAKREELGLADHIWEEDKAKAVEFPGFRGWQCALCKQWTSLKMSDAEAEDIAKALDAGEQIPGQPACTGKLAEAEGDPAADKCANCGHIRLEHAEGVCPGHVTERWAAIPDPLQEAADKVANNLEVDAKNEAKKAARKAERKGKGKAK